LLKGEKDAITLNLHTQKDEDYYNSAKQDNENLWIDLNGDGEKGAGETKSYDAWYQEMNNMTEGDYDELTDATRPAWEATHKKKLAILAGTEAGVINRFEAIPMTINGTSNPIGRLKSRKCGEKLH